MHVALVANSRSGGRTDGAELFRCLERAGAKVVPLDITDLDGRLPAGLDRLVIAGGDGSIGVAARAAHQEGIPLAIVPTGTANDFARALGLPRDPEHACLLAADPAATTRHHEVGVIEGHPFVNAAAGGLSAAASRIAKPYKARLGPLAYVFGAVRAGLVGSPLPCVVRADGEERFAGAVWQVVVGVTGAFGGGSAIGGTRHDDAQLDVAVIPAGPRMRLVRYAYRMRRGSLTRHADVGHHRGHSVELDLAEGTRFNVDGDLHEFHRPRFSLLTGGVEIVIP